MFSNFRFFYTQILHLLYDIYALIFMQVYFYEYNWNRKSRVEHYSTFQRVWKVCYILFSYMRRFCISNHIINYQKLFNN